MLSTQYADLEAGNQGADEHTPLRALPARASSPFRRYCLTALGATLTAAVISYDRSMSAYNALALQSTVAVNGEAFQNFDTIYKYSMYACLPLVAGRLVLDTIADRGYLKYLRKVVSTFIDINNTYSMALKLYIAVYLAFKDLGLSPVIISDPAFWTKFVLVVGVMCLLHGILELTKNKWRDSNRVVSTSCNVTLQGLETINKASNINGAALRALSIFGGGETGTMNPYVRLGIFTNISLLAAILQVISNYGQEWNESTHRLINGASTFAYLSGIFSSPLNSEFSNSELNTMILYFVAVGFMSVISAKLFPPVERPTQVISQDVVTPARATRSAETVANDNTEPTIERRRSI